MSDNGTTDLSHLLRADRSIPISTKSRLIVHDAMRRCAELQQRCRTPLLFGGTTALRVHGIDVPAALEDEPITVVYTSDKSRHRIADAQGFQWQHPVRFVIKEGLRVVSPETAWLMLAHRLEPIDVVALGDALMRRHRELQRTTLEQLREDVGKFTVATHQLGMRMPRGFDACLDALDVMREGTDSMPESTMRLTLMMWGLPCPEVNPAIGVAAAGRDAPARRYFADCAYPDLKLMVEYDGKHHEERWEKDLRRLDDLAAAGWTRVGASHEDFRDEQSAREFAQRVAQRMTMLSGRRVEVSGPLTIHKLAVRARRQARGAR